MDVYSILPGSVTRTFIKEPTLFIIHADQMGMLSIYTVLQVWQGYLTFEKQTVYDPVISLQVSLTLRTTYYKADQQLAWDPHLAIVTSLPRNQLIVRKSNLC